MPIHLFTEMRVSGVTYLLQPSQGFPFLPRIKIDILNLVYRSLSDLEVKWKSLSHAQLFTTPCAIQSMEFSRPEYWSGWPFPSPWDLPDSGVEPRSPALQVILHQLSHQGSQRILEWVAYPFSRGSSPPRSQTGVFCIAGGFFTSWATKVSVLDRRDDIDLVPL